MEDQNYSSTDELKVPTNIIDQVLGQEDAVAVVKKAAKQRRHVLLIGEPGTGKSMIGLGLAELLPKEKLVDVIAFPNPNDENQPLIRTMPAGKGRDLVNKARISSLNLFKNQTIFMFIIVLIVSLLPWYWWRFGDLPDVVFAASMITGVIFIVGFMLFINLGRKANGKVSVPKVIVDNFGKKQAPFNDATGAHAGALLGDCLHDPFQTFCKSQFVTKFSDSGLESVNIKSTVDSIFSNPQNQVLSREQNNYEAVHSQNKELLLLGETNNSISPVEVLSSNRYDYEGKMIKLTTAENKELIVTPEHKIAVWNDGKIEYLEAQKIQAGEKVVSKAKDIIIDELDIIGTYDERQQKLSASYFRYTKLKSENPEWGYKKIASEMGVSYGHTRCWWENDTSPVPIQTVNWLKQKGLLPLTIDNPKLPIIAKVLGATFGDGGIFENLNGIFLSSSEKEAVEEFGRDLEKIGGMNEGENSRIIEGGEYGHSWCYQNTNRNVIRFFAALGAPLGKKTIQELLTPGWIKLHKNSEKQFYGSFIGSELDTPIIHKQGNYLTSLELGISSIPKLKDNRMQLLADLKNYLNKNRIRTTSIYLGKSKTEGNLVYRLLIEKKFDNVILFLLNININYCKHKVDRLYKALGKWASLKKNKYYELVSRGYGAENAMKTLNLTPNSLYLLLNHFGEKSET
jgi:ATP-dependent Lon protease